MTVALRTNWKIVQQLGRAGLEELAAHLWAVDCQTCGRPLGHRPPALVVDDLIVIAAASLHHTRCRRPQWNATAQITFSGEALLSHVARTLLVPLHDGSELVDVRPVLLVNPSLEQVQLRRGPDDRWRVSTVEIYGQDGLGPPGAGLDLEHPIAGIRGRITGAEVAVHLGPVTWSAPMEPSVEDRVRELGGVLLAVTTMVHPGELDDPQPFIAAVASDQVAMAWVAVDGGEGPSSEQLEQLVNPQAPAARVHPGEVPDLAPYSGSTYDRATGKFEMGVGAADEAVHWTLHTPGRGMEHGLITGPSESGKTNSLRIVLVEAIQAPHFVVMIADPLDRNRLCDTFRSVADRCARNYGETVDLLEGAIRAIDARCDAGGYTDPGPDHPSVVIAIDDAEAVLRNKHAAALAAQIVVRGGPAGVGA